MRWSLVVVAMLTLSAAVHAAWPSASDLTLAVQPKPAKPAATDQEPPGIAVLSAPNENFEIELGPVRPVNPMLIKLLQAVANPLGEPVN